MPSQFSTQLFLLPFIFLLLFAIIDATHLNGADDENPNPMDSKSKTTKNMGDSGDSGEKPIAMPVVNSKWNTVRNPINKAKVSFVASLQKPKWNNSTNNRHLDASPSLKESRRRLTYIKSMHLKENSNSFKASAVNEGKKSYIDHIMPSYGSPEPFSRIVKIGKKNETKWLVSKDKSMQSILEFVQEKLGLENPMLKAVFELEEGNSEETFPKKGCHVSFHFDSRTINQKVFLFDIGTRVTEETIAHLKLFEEQGTGRKMIFKKEKEEKEIAEKKDDEEDEEGDDDEEEEPILLSTYATMGAIQKGKDAFVEGAKLDMTNIPKDRVLKDKKLIDLVIKFFDDIIEACDDKMDKMEDEPLRPLDKDEFNLKDFLKKIKENGGKMESKEDMDMFREEQDKIMRKMLESVRTASEYDRVEIKELAEKQKKEFEEETNAKHQGEKEKLMKEEYKPYEFLKTVQFAINARPAFIEFKKLTFTEYEELVAISEEWGKLKQSLNWLRIEQKLNDDDVEKLLEKAKEGFKEFDNELAKHKIKLNDDDVKKLLEKATEGFEEFENELANHNIKLSKNKMDDLREKASKGFDEFDNELLAECENLNNEIEDLKEAFNWPKPEEILTVPLNERLARDEYEMLMEFGGTSEKFNEFKDLAMRLREKKKLNADEFGKLMAVNGDNSKLKSLIDGAMRPVHQGIADSLIYGKKSAQQKVNKFTKGMVQKVGNFLDSAANTVFKWIGKKVKLIKSKEITSAEQEEKRVSKAIELKMLQQARRAAIADAITKINQNRKCHLLSEPIRFAIYDESEERELEKQLELQKAKMKNEMTEAESSKKQEESNLSHFNLDMKLKRNVEATQDLRARLGAQAVNAVVNTKFYPEGHGMALSMSLLGSGAIGIFLDVLMVPLFVMAATNIFGPIPYIGATMVIILKYIIKPSLESITPMGAETFDSAIIKQYMATLKGKKFWRGVKQFQKSLASAFESGVIASLGSIFYNFSMLASTNGALPIQMFFNVISTISSAAMVPFELMKDRNNMIKSLYYKMEENKLFPKPSEEKQDEMAIEMQQNYKKLWKRLFVKNPLPKQMQQGESRKWAYMNWLEQQTWRTMEVQKSSRISINSMGIGPIISSAVFLFMNYFQSATDAPETLVNAISVMVNSPTEMISYTAAIFGADNLGLEFAPWLLSTDEQKNGLIMGEIFEKSRIQMEKGNFVKIEDAQMDQIYNPYMAITMPMGKFFVKSGMWLKKKWENYRQRQKYSSIVEANTKSGNRGVNPKKLIVENYRKDVVYLITFPRTNSLPTLSPKAMALEYWLKIQGEGIKFYRVADAFFIPKMFTDSFPYVELNGKKFSGRMEKIIDSISKELGLPGEDKNLNENKLAYLLAQLETALIFDRKKAAMKFMYEDKALLMAMMSTMSQIFPDLIEYDPHYMDSWDTLPAQLKGAFNLMGAEIDNKLRKMDSELKKMESRLPEYRNVKHKLINELNIMKIMEEIVKSLKKNEKLGEGDSTQHKKQYLFGEKPSYLDGFFFGLLTQFFETPLSTDEFNNYFAKHKNSKSNSILLKYYTQIAEEMTGGKKDLWRKRIDDEEPLPLNFDLMPEEIDEEGNSTKGNYSYHADTDKYEGQFNFKFVHFLNGKTMSAEQKVEIRKFSGLKEIGRERPVPIGLIKAQMRATKMNHPYLGPLWKVTKEWGDEEFAEELKKRVAEQKRERFVHHVHEKILMLPEKESNALKQTEEQTVNRSLAPEMAAIVDRLLELVWKWETPMQREMMKSIQHIDILDKSAHELGEKIGKIFDKYMEKLGENEKSKRIEIETDTKVYEEFVLWDKSREYFDKIGREDINKRVDKFYNEELKTEMLELIGKGKTSAGAIGKRQHPADVDVNAINLIMNEQHNTNITKKEKAKEKVEKLITEMQEPTIKELVHYVSYIFDQEASEHLLNAADWVAKEAVAVEKESGHALPIEKYFEEILEKITISQNEEGLKPEMHRCIQYFFKRQQKRLDYIRNNYGRIGTDKSRLSTQDRLFRLFDRFINMKKIMSIICPKEMEIHLFAHIKPKVDENEASTSSSMAQNQQHPELKYEKRTVKLDAILSKFDDKEWQEKFRIKYKKLKNEFNEMEKKRNTDLDQVVAIYTFNERTKELVKAKIEATNLFVQRDEIEEKLGKENADVLQISMTHEIKNSEIGGQSFGPLRDGLAKKMQKILEQQTKCTNIFHLVVPESKKECIKILEDVVDKYKEMKKFIDNDFHVNVTDRNRLKEPIDTKITEIEAIKVEINQIYEKYKKNGKELILKEIEGITADEIRSKAKLEKFKILSFKWETKMSKEEAAKKKERMKKELLDKILKDSNLWQPLESGMHEIHLKMFVLDHGAPTSEIRTDKEWKEKLTKLGDVPEKSKTAKLLAKFEEIKEEKCRDMIQAKVGEMYKKEVEQRRDELFSSIKYRIAKGILHLAGAYLCEGGHCKEEHMEMAKKELAEISRNPKATVDILHPAVKKLVFYTINDFNEHCVIREEILEQFGLPLEKPIVDAYKKKPFWYTENSKAPEDVAEPQEASEVEQEHNLKHNADNTKGKVPAIDASAKVMEHAFEASSSIHEPLLQHNTQ